MPPETEHQPDPPKTATFPLAPFDLPRPQPGRSRTLSCPAAVTIDSAPHDTTPAIDLDKDAATERLSALIDWRDLLARASFGWNDAALSLDGRNAPRELGLGGITDIILDDKTHVALRFGGVLRRILTGAAPPDEALRGEFDAGSKDLGAENESRPWEGEEKVTLALRRLVDVRMEMELCWGFIGGDHGNSDDREG
jgi:hypothetical protein